MRFASLPSLMQVGVRISETWYAGVADGSDSFSSLEGEYQGIGMSWSRCSWACGSAMFGTMEISPLTRTGRRFSCVDVQWVMLKFRL